MDQGNSNVFYGHVIVSNDIWPVMSASKTHFILQALEITFQETPRTSF